LCFLRLLGLDLAAQPQFVVPTFPASYSPALGYLANRKGRLHHQVKTVAHQTASMHLKPGLLTGPGQRFEKILPIHVIPADVLLAIPRLMR